MEQIKRWLIFIIMIYSTNTLANIDIDRLKQLFDSGNSQQAYDYAFSKLTAHEGEADFDYYYGASAIDVGRASEGVFALERVLISQPGHLAARLELARGYFILEEYARSRAEFRLLLKANPPDDVVDKVHTYLDTMRIEEGRHTTIHTAYVEAGFGTDSNVNSGPSDPTIFFLGQVGQLSASSLEQRDNFSELTANYRITTPVTTGISFNVSINGKQRSNSDRSELDTGTYTGSAGFRFLHAKDKYSVRLIAQQFNVDGNGYRKLIGLDANWSRHLSQKTTLMSFLQFSKQDFSGQTARNVSTSTLGIGLTKRINTSLSSALFSSVYMAQDDPESSSDISKQIAERDYYGARIGTIVNTSPKSSVQFSVNYQSSEYGLEDINGILREDDYTSAELDFKWTLSRNWSLLADASYIQNDSSNTLNEYSRKLASISFRYETK
jgi:tetratricopeptide (TPR) repeat protein